MSLEDELHSAMLAAYGRAGREVGYWGNYFLRSVKSRGGLETAERMLRPSRGRAPQKGLQALLRARRADLSLESLVLQPRFAKLFTGDELAEARRRLAGLPLGVFRRSVPPDEVHPEEVTDPSSFHEGGTRRVVVNAYERDPRARTACLKKHGYSCGVCGLLFEKRYGDVGRAFIHVHHLVPVATRRSAYRLNAVKDLIPVCPNCHAMLHKCEPPLLPDELKRMLHDVQANMGLQPPAGARATGGRQSREARARRS